jgi:PEP-CTERM motif
MKFAKFALGVAMFGTVAIPQHQASAQIVSSFPGLSTLAPNDDGSTGLVSLGFTANFYGLSATQVYVNNNGNITFGAPLSTFTPFPILSTGTSMIAPFFADVDTRGGGSPVQYGTGTFLGHAAFMVNWINVCFFSANCANIDNFQLVMIDRSDVAAGDFDFEFNYGHMGFESGEASGSNGLGRGGFCARWGWSNGVDQSFEGAGSGVCGALIDGGSNALITATNDGVPGQEFFGVRSGAVVQTSTVPEPATMSLMATGLVAMAGMAKRRRSR